MTSTLIDGIGVLVTNDPTNPAGDGSPLGIVLDAAMVIEDSVIVWAGPSHAAGAADHGHDLAGATVVPGFVDSHSHLVFAGDRAAEFAARMSGIPYTAGGNRYHGRRDKSRDR